MGFVMVLDAPEGTVVLVEVEIELSADNFSRASSTAFLKSFAISTVLKRTAKLSDTGLDSE